MRHQLIFRIYLKLMVTGSSFLPSKIAHLLCQATSENQIVDKHNGKKNCPHLLSIHPSPYLSLSIPITCTYNLPTFQHLLPQPSSMTLVRESSPGVHPSVVCAWQSYFHSGSLLANQYGQEESTCVMLCYLWSLTRLWNNVSYFYEFRILYLDVGV